MTLTYLGIKTKSEVNSKSILTFPVAKRKAKNNGKKEIQLVEAVRTEEVPHVNVTRRNLNEFHKFFTSSFAIG